MQYLLPPSIYLIECDQGQFTGETYGDAIIHLRQVQHERDICASRIKGINDWVKNK